MNRNESGQAAGGILVLIAIALVVGLFMSLASIASTPADKVGVVYGGGPIDEKKYIRTVESGSGLMNIGLFNDMYEYPTTQRTYIADPDDKHADLHGTISTVTKDNVQVHWRVNTYFKLNTDKVKDFHQGIGFKYHAWEDDGWNRMLNDVFRPQIESALQTASRKYTVEELFSSQEVILAVQAEVSEGLQANVNDVLGGDFFCGPAFVPGKGCPDFKFLIPKKPDIPAGIVEAFEKNKSSEVEVQTAANNVKVKQQEAQGIRVLANATREAGNAYLSKLQMDALMAAAENGSLNLWVMPSDASGNIVLPAPSRSK